MYKSLKSKAYNRQEIDMKCHSQNCFKIMSKEIIVYWT